MSKEKTLEEQLAEKLPEIVRFLGIKNEKEFVEMDQQAWKDLFEEKLSQAKLDEAKENQWKIIGSNLAEEMKRQEVLALAKLSTEYQSLFEAAQGTVANKQQQEEKNAIINPPSNIATSSADGKPTNNYTIAGNTPEEIKENITNILAEYEKYVAKNYPDEKEKYKPKHELFNTFEKLKASDTFKKFSEDEQKHYEAAKDKFPTKIVTLSFKTADEGKNFMKEMQDKKYIRNPLEVAEEKKKAAEEEKKSPPASPSPSPTSSNV